MGVGWEGACGCVVEGVVDEAVEDEGEEDGEEFEWAEGGVHSIYDLRFTIYDLDYSAPEARELRSFS